MTIHILRIGGLIWRVAIPQKYAGRTMRLRADNEIDDSFLLRIPAIKDTGGSWEGLDIVYCTF